MSFLDCLDYQLSGNMSFLDCLDLSNNRFSGNIPTKTQPQSFDALHMLGTLNSMVNLGTLLVLEIKICKILQIQVVVEAMMMLVQNGLTCPRFV